MLQQKRQGRRSEIPRERLAAHPPAKYCGVPTTIRPTFAPTTILGRNGPATSIASRARARSAKAGRGADDKRRLDAEASRQDGTSSLRGPHRAGTSWTVEETACPSRR